MLGFYLSRYLKIAQRIGSIMPTSTYPFDSIPINPSHSVKYALSLSKFMEQIDCGEAISGFTKYQPAIIQPIREVQYRNGNITHKANAHFCPNCSKTREKDTQNGGFKDKWVVGKDDYKFTLEYRTDDNGNCYAACSKCDFDVRSHQPQYDTYVSIIIREDDEDGPPLPLSMFEEVHYEQGFFLFPNTEHERIRKIGTEENGRILPATEIDGSRYAISWNDFLSKVRSFPGLSIVGIPKTYFKSL